MKIGRIVKLFEIKRAPKGTFAAVKFNGGTTKAVKEFIKANNVPNGLREDDMHATLLYSRKHLPNYEAAGDLETPMTGKFHKFEIFPSNGGEGESTNCLVLRLKCPELTARHKYLMKEHGATYDFDEYKPHLTLSYDVGQLDPSTLPDFDKDLVITNEYSNDLED